MYLSTDVPVREEGWVDPDFVPKRTLRYRLQRQFHRMTARLGNFGWLEVLVVLLVIGGVLYYLSLNPGDGSPPRRGVFFR
jgi:hypothetical protein